MTLRPTYSIALGATTLSSDTLGPLVALEVERAKNGGADRALLALGRRPEVSPSEGDPATMELGWDGDTSLVFTGEVQAVDRGVLGLEVSCAGSAVKLLRARVDQTYRGQSAGQVVSALASNAGVDTDTVEDGVRLPTYLADSATRAWDHCLRLARRCGFDLYTTEGGALVFAAFATTSADVTFRYGIDVVSVSIERTAHGDGVAVVPESPASGQGDDASSWLVKDPSPYRGEAGGAATMVLSDPALRTKEAADTAARGLMDFRRREAVTGVLELMGSPGVTLGQSVALDGLPDDVLNDTYQVLAVRHALDRRRGFRTIVGLGGMPGGGP
jgi:phage protein D